MGWTVMVAMCLAAVVEAAVYSDPCSPNPCGANTRCFSRDNRPVCSCLPGHWGNPLTSCRLGECSESGECRGDKVCRDYRCVGACEGQCGAGAQCTSRSHVPVCSCPPGTTGDPLASCRQADPQEACRPSPCGENTSCRVVNGVATCSCLDGYEGSPLSGCRRECETDSQCGPSLSCQRYKCVPICTPGACAPNAHCRPVNHRAVCSCPPGKFGDPYVGSCSAECESHYDCPADRPACGAGTCHNPCAGQVCGHNADCTIKHRTTPVCSCPRHMTGDPFVSCRPFEKTDLCIPNPCGENAQCTPGHDNTGRERPVCTCLPGFLGDALISCRRGECQTNSECRNDQTCINYKCVRSCDEGQCGVGAECRARNHVAVCSCGAGQTGDPLSRCYPVPAPVDARHLRQDARRIFYK